MQQWQKGVHLQAVKLCSISLALAASRECSCIVVAALKEVQAQKGGCHGGLGSAAWVVGGSWPALTSQPAVASSVQVQIIRFV